MSALAWLLALGAAARITLLVVADEITKPLRERIWERPRVELDHGIGYLLTCPWCASIWVAPPVLASGLAWGDGWGWQLAAGSLAVSFVVGWLASFASPG
jgi:hypothetical protein